jgi:8-oxo-dGTP diphosphatase
VGVTPVERRRRIAAYGLCRDGDGRVLLVLSGGPAGLPGGSVAHGEHPAQAVLRLFQAQTGLQVAIERVLDVVTDVEQTFDVPVLQHHDRIIFDVRVEAGDLRADQAAYTSETELEQLDVAPYVERLLKGGADQSDVDWPPETGASADPPTHRQRFAAYGLVTDPAGQVLLALIAPGYPGAGFWHLPGGGTDFGESAASGMLRELVEETDQRGEIVGLINVSHRHHRSAVGPEGVPIDWHGIRVVYRVRVSQPRPPRVVEEQGSTEAAAWFERRAALDLPLTEVAREMIAEHTA